MRIDFLTSNLSVGGAERVMILLANHFTKKHQVNIVMLNDGVDYELDEGINLIDLNHVNFKIKKLQSLVNLLIHYKKKENRPDVIIPFITQVNLLGILVAKIYGFPVIASEHNSHLRKQTPIWLTNFTWKFIYPKSNFVTVLTPFDIPFFKKKKVNVVVMPNPSTFLPITENNHTRDKIILAVGGLDRYWNKGFDSLISIFKEVQKLEEDWKLQIIGNGDNGLDFLTKLVEKHELKEKVEFLGYKKNVSDYMYKSSIFILPSRLEGLPMVLLEAMSQGMACIAFDCKTGPSSIIVDKVNGFLIEDQNIEEMIEKLSLLMMNESLRKKLSNEGIKSLENFSIESIGNQWEKLFKQL
ncbi:glycosyltransferase family 4 protein [Flagellimonas zhangzhouensis]|uniref:Glycosyltransferase involved in cell wall bisynthesis n=1 Tax=Flagellimonas zhangzhouensis TaxID=1073328 RepID=A0A1H2YS07_9FLAO|nr:glycosyltransferase family 4 protein [Allomuricauda zhangzhouensis]SDR00235.1 GalNAc-alpha-(1->4)-GalNAc-alpha-(1->3)-diNAcBac-PP-undecaprenol alpha-1,4-N-acetyl-D-galactosaminyltransferase [Allomuricauda zhangzhouensis]SDX07588.1 Glycosyltransferase involved in cell wall bisynthesis [Allomuricauda zhangzhouensis]